MTSAQSRPQRQSRLAWLTPLQISQSFGKSWVLTYTSSQWIARKDPGCTKVTADALLLLLEATVNINDRELQTEDGACATYSSDCGRYEVHWRQNKSTAERLFVQQASDYFQHIELVIDGRVAVAYQEPVWPYLQAPRAKTPARLMIPTDCMGQLAAASRGQIRSPAHETSGTTYDDSDDLFAAA